MASLGLLLKKIGLEDKVRWLKLSHLNEPLYSSLFVFSQNRLKNKFWKCKRPQQIDCLSIYLYLSLAMYQTLTST